MSSEFDELFEEENRETRMPKVDGVPITEGLSERAHEKVRDPGTETGTSTDAHARSENPSEGLSEREAVPGVGPGTTETVQADPPSRSESPYVKAGTSGGIPESQTTEAISAPASKSGAAGVVAAPSVNSRARADGSRVTAPGCTYDPRPGAKCPACGKVHVRKGRAVKINVPAGDVRTDFKTERKR